MRNKESWFDWVNPLYIPLVTAIPIDIWLIFFKDRPFSGTDITLFIVAILFLVFSGSVETSQEEIKHRSLGYLYLVSALLFGASGLYLWLMPI